MRIYKTEYNMYELEKKLKEITFDTEQEKLEVINHINNLHQKKIDDEINESIEKADIDRLFDMLKYSFMYADKQRERIKTRYNEKAALKQEQHIYQFQLDLESSSIYQLRDMVKRPLYYTKQELDLIKQKIATKESHIRDFLVEDDVIALEEMDKNE
jgi:hypothetical protein